MIHVIVYLNIAVFCSSKTLHAKPIQTLFTLRILHVVSVNNCIICNESCEVLIQRSKDTRQHCAHKLPVSDHYQYVFFLDTKRFTTRFSFHFTFFMFFLFNQSERNNLLMKIISSQRICDIHFSYNIDTNNLFDNDQKFERCCV